MIHDLRWAFRAVWSAPGTYGAAAFSLGIGIAAVTCVWAGADRLMLRPLPYDPGGELAWVGTAVASRGSASSPSSVPDFVDLRARLRSMDVAAYRDGGVSLGNDPAEWAVARRVSAGFLGVVGVEPVLGRGIGVDDEAEGAPDVAVVGHAVWSRLFGSDPDVLGRTLLVDGTPIPVVGVMPARYAFARGRPEVWLPLHLGSSEPRGARRVQVVARVHGDDLRRARAELATAAAALAEAYPASNAERSFLVADLLEELYGGPTFQQGLIGALVATLTVLLIACANVANLLLARGADRANEMALRRALGCGGWRIGRQLFFEVLMLAAMGGGYGLALSVFGIRGMASLLPSEFAVADDMAVDARVAAMALAVAGGSALFFGLAPAVRTVWTSGRLRRPLLGGRAPSQAGGGGLRSVLVAAEVGLALVLVVMTTLVVRSVVAIRSTDAGFATEGIIAFDLSLPERAYPGAGALRSAAGQIRDAFASEADVEAVGLGDGLPGRSWRSLRYRVPDADPDTTGGRGPSLIVRVGDPGWLPTLGVEVARGRPFEASDDADSRDVALVNQRLANRLWPGTDPLGQRIVLASRTVEVVGVVADLREFGPAFPASDAAYLPLAQWPTRRLSVVVRARGAAPGMLGWVRSVTARVDPALAPHGGAALEDVLMESSEQFTSFGTLLGVLAGAALVLALVGVFASMAYAVTRRVPEIGVRMALGASPRRVRQMVLRRALRTSAFGLAGGLFLALPAARGVRSFLFGVRPTDPVTFAAVALLLLLVSLTAAWVPARRASAVDPIRALRAGG